MILRFLAPLVMGSIMASAAEKNMKPYPAAEEGMVRHALHLDKRDDESEVKIELVLGKTVETDGVNRHFFGGKLERRIAEGWGYSYYILPQLGPMAGTRMAAPPGTPKIKKFVKLGGEPFWVRYNSKLPVVVYAPKGVEVRYRLWTAAPEAQAIPEG